LGDESDAAKGFRRARNYGFLQPNSKRLNALLRLLVFQQPTTSSAPCTPTGHPQLLCRCGATMAIVRRQIFPSTTEAPRVRHEDKSA
jgi:hypothetical protein